MVKIFQIVLVDDNRSYKERLLKEFSFNNYQSYSASNADDLDELFLTVIPDLLIVDSQVIGESAQSIVRRYRLAYRGLFIILMTFGVDPKERANAYLSGADMCFTKPVSMDEILAGISTIKRRIFDNHGFVNLPRFDFLLKKISNSGLTTSLTLTDSILLKGFIEATDNSLEYHQLLNLIRKEDTAKNKISLSVYIHRLSKKLLSVGLTEPVIKAIWKKGYQLTARIHIDD